MLYYIDNSFNFYSTKFKNVLNFPAPGAFLNKGARNLIIYQVLRKY
jgi:hypothetical protein